MKRHYSTLILKLMSTFFIIVCDACKYYTKEGERNLKSFCINTCNVFVKCLYVRAYYDNRVELQIYKEKVNQFQKS